MGFQSCWAHCHRLQSRLVQASAQALVISRHFFWFGHSWNGNSLPVETFTGAASFLWIGQGKVWKFGCCKHVSLCQNVLGTPVGVLQNALWQIHLNSCWAQCCFFFFLTTYCSSLADFRIDFGIFWQACRLACQNLWGSGVTMVHPPLRSKSRSVLLGCPSLTNSPDRRICSRSPVQDFGKQMSRNVACSNSRASHTHRVTGSPKRIETLVPIMFLLFPGDLFFTPAGLRTVLPTEVMVASATQNSLQDSQLGSCLTCLDDKSTIPGPTFGMALTTSRPSGLRVRHVAHCSRAFAPCPCDPQCGAVPDAWDGAKHAETPVAKRKTWRESPTREQASVYVYLYLYIYTWIYIYIEYLVIFIVFIVVITIIMIDCYYYYLSSHFLFMYLFTCLYSYLLILLLINLCYLIYFFMCLFVCLYMGDLRWSTSTPISTCMIMHAYVHE